MPVSEPARPASAAAHSPRLSIVIPAFNEERRLRQSVQRIREACAATPSIAAAYEIVVCDNNSTDTTAMLAEQADCRVIFEPVNQISRARNRGASVASGEWLLFIDADSWPPPELMGDVAALLSDATCIGCGSTIRVVDGPRWFKYAWESKNWSMRAFRWCPGAFLLCRRDAFQEINGFSEEHYLFEEGGLCQPVEEARCYTRAEVHHPTQAPVPYLGSPGYRARVLVVAAIRPEAVAVAPPSRARQAVRACVVQGRAMRASPRTLRRFLLLAAAGVFGAIALASLVAPHRMARQLGYELTTIDALSEFRAVYVGVWLATAVLLIVAAVRVDSLLLGDLGALLILGQTLGRILSLAIDGMPSASIWAFFALECLGGGAILIVRPRVESLGTGRDA